MLLFGLAAFVFFITVGSYIVPYLYSNAVLRKVFRETADKMGFRFSQATILQRPVLEGDAEKVSFTIRAFYQNPLSRNRKTVVQISARPFFLSDYNLHIESEGFASKISSMMGKSDILTGDPVFDKEMLIKGTELDAVSLLSRKTRAWISSFAQSASDFHFSTTSASCTVSSWGIDSNLIIQKIRTILDIYSSIKDEKSRYERLIAHYFDEKNDTVRKKIIRILAAHFPDRDRTEGTLIHATNDESWQVRIEALRYLGNKGESRIFDFLSTSRDETKIELIKLLGTMKIEDAGKKLIPYFRKADSGDLKKEILKTLTMQADHAASGFLCSILSEAKGELLQETLNALHTCGTLDALGPLFTLKDHIFNPILKSSVNNTIKQIQHRYAGIGEPGMLSLTGDTEEEGSLSLIDEEEETDSLSITDDE